MAPIKIRGRGVRPAPPGHIGRRLLEVFPQHKFHTPSLDAVYDGIAHIDAGLLPRLFCFQKAYGLSILALDGGEYPPCLKIHTIHPGPGPVIAVSVPFAFQQHEAIVQHIAGFLTPVHTRQSHGNRGLQNTGKLLPQADLLKSGRLHGIRLIDRHIQLWRVRLAGRGMVSGDIDAGGFLHKIQQRPILQNEIHAGDVFIARPQIPLKGIEGDGCDLFLFVCHNRFLSEQIANCKTSGCICASFWVY